MTDARRRAAVFATRKPLLFELDGELLTFSLNAPLLTSLALKFEYATFGYEVLPALR